MQQEIPPDKLSRVYSYDALGSVGLVPLGYALAGPAADAFGVQATLRGAAAIGIGCHAACPARPRRPHAGTTRGG